MMKKETRNTIEVFPSVYSEPYYELEAWTKLEETDMEDAKDQLEDQGEIDANYRIDCVSVCHTKERALEEMDMFLDIVYETEEYLDRPIFLLREKPLCSMMEPHSYIKEWTYVGSLLEDESLVRNYALQSYPFMGRPKEMIRHKVGDIVMVVEGGCSFWGVVASVPRTYDGKPHGDYSDDQYTVYTSAGCHSQCLAHHVLDEFAPECVEELLRAELSEFFV